MYINVHSSIHNSKEAEMAQVSKNGQIKCVRACSVVSNSLRPHGRSLPAPVSMGFPRDAACQLLCPWDFPGKNTGVGSYFFLQGTLTQGSNPRLPYWQAHSLPLSRLGVNKRCTSVQNEVLTDATRQTNAESTVKWKKPVTKEHMLHGTMYMGRL